MGTLKGTANTKGVLREHQAEISKKFGVNNIGVFGSAVRNELCEDSDIDIVVEFKDSRGDMYDFAGLADFLENLFGRSVDILTPAGIDSIRIDHIKRTIKGELEYV